MIAKRTRNPHIDPSMIPMVVDPPEWEFRGAMVDRADTTEG